MKNFKLIKTFDVAPILKEIEKTTLWNWMNLRRAEGLNHKSVDDIVLRFNPVQSMFTYADFFNELGCVDYFTQMYLPQTMQLVREFAEDKIIGRVVVAKLKEAAIIAQHVDEGDYAKWHDRYHFVITTNPAVNFFCGDEKQHMAVGEIWWFDNKTEHSVVNLGNSSRIHIVADIRKF